MKTTIFTIETNGFLEDTNLIHYGITLCYETKELKYYNKNNIEDLIKELKESDRIIGHNIVGFHIKAIQKLYPNFNVSDNNIFDTYIVSKLLYRDLEKHTLYYFGEKFKVKVPFVKDYNTISEPMKNKSKANIRILYKLYSKMLKDIENQNITDELIELEMSFARIIDKQVENGFKFDIDLAKKVHIQLVKKQNTKQLNILSNGNDSLIHSTKEDGRIRGQVDTIGSKTGRCSHFKPNISGVPKVKHLRSLFIVEEGYKLVGCDASNLELRLLAHYMRDTNYIETIENGDIHELNRELTGLSTRDEAKTFVYSMLYGSGNKSLGKKLNKELSESEQFKLGKNSKDNFMKGLPKFEKLMERLLITYKQRGYIKSLEGRTIIVDKEYKLLNALLQTSASDLMKRFAVCLEKNLIDNNIDFKFVGNFHDEIQIETNQPEEVSNYCNETIKQVVKYYKLRCGFKVDTKIGNNWWDTH